jgi:hypothetical protein
VGTLDHELALRDVAAAARIDPANPDVRDLGARIRADLKAQAQKEKTVRCAPRTRCQSDRTSPRLTCALSVCCMCLCELGL